jgi:hypothetical protein
MMWDGHDEEADPVTRETGGDQADEAASDRSGA